MFNDETGTYDPPPRVVVYDGRCLVYAAERDAQTVMLAGVQALAVVRYTVMLPHDVPVEIGDLLKVTSSPRTDLMTGLEVHITDAPQDAYAVVRHCAGETF